MKHDKIAVLDFGGQYAHLIATKVRRMRVRTDIVDPVSPLDVFRQYRGLILSGSPALSAYGEGADYNHGIFDLGIPILGLCYGHQEIAKRYGGRIEHTRREYGPARLRIVAESPIGCLAAVHSAATTENFLALEFHSVDVPWSSAKM